MDVDDTLVLILERIDSPVSLIRAASTCRRWRRLIADAGFLRHFRSVHGPPVAGDYYNGEHSWSTQGSHAPWFVPSSSINSHHFSLDFVVGTSIFPHRSRCEYNPSWVVLDSRGSLLLMECFHYLDDRAFPDYVICEPLTRRYKIIPQPPDYDDAHWGFQGPYLIDGDEEAGGRIGMSNFRVLCVLFCRDDDAVYTTMFTACGERDATWSEKAIDHITSKLRVGRSYCLGRVLGSCYFYLKEDGKLITLDGRMGKFSLSVLPQAIKKHCDSRILTKNFTIVDGGDGEPRIITMTKDHTLEVFARVDGEWGLENKVSLSKVTCGLPGYQPHFFNKPLTIMVIGGKIYRANSVIRATL